MHTEFDIQKNLQRHNIFVTEYKTKLSADSSTDIDYVS